MDAKSAGATAAYIVSFVMLPSVMSSSPSGQDAQFHLAPTSFATLEHEMGNPVACSLLSLRRDCDRGLAAILEVDRLQIFDAVLGDVIADHAVALALQFLHVDIGR